MFWIILAFIAGIFVPAPYDALAKEYVSKAYAWVKSLF